MSLPRDWKKHSQYSNSYLQWHFLGHRYESCPGFPWPPFEEAVLDLPGYRYGSRPRFFWPQLRKLSLDFLGFPCVREVGREVVSEVVSEVVREVVREVGA